METPGDLPWCPTNRSRGAVTTARPRPPAHKSPETQIPDFIAGDDWLTAATDAHNSFLASLGIPCDRASCDLHDICAS